LPGRWVRSPSSTGSLKPTADSWQLTFKPTVGKVLLSVGMEAKLNCSIDIPILSLEPTIVWWKDGLELHGSLQAVVNDLHTAVQGVSQEMVTLLSTLRSVLRDHAGEYVCKLNVSDAMIKSQPIVIQVEGLPMFTRHPEDVNVTRGTPFSLSCDAVGPPEPITILWLRDYSRMTVDSGSPQNITVP
ncbi:hypothetical protein Z043_107259, partial [Scleropages formosus]